MVLTQSSAIGAVKEYAKVAVCIALTLFLFILMGIMLQHDGAIWQSSPEMSFEGTGSALATNTIATVSFTFSHIDKEVAKARDVVTHQVEQAYLALENLGMAKKDIQTTSYTVYPEYDYVSFNSLAPSKRELVGYRVAHITSVTIKDFDMIGSLLTVVTNFEPTELNGPIFSPDEEGEKQAEDTAIAEAIHAAKQRAEKVARLSGFHLKKITDIQVYDDARPLYRKAEMSFDAVSSSVVQSVPVYQGENTIIKRATVSYEIKEFK